MTFTVVFLCDYVEEGWPSMDLVGTLLPDAVGRLDPGVRVERHQPRARRWYGTAGRDGWSPSIRERLINRYVFYPLWQRRQPLDHRVFHVLDHTYAHLVHQLPAQRTVVTCHDLDAFLCELEPERSPRPWLFRRAVRHTMTGLQRAARIGCVSEAVRDALVAAGLAERARTFVVSNGIHEAFRHAPGPEETAEADRLLGPRAQGALDLLHVGIPIPRKRIDVAIEVLARLRQRRSPVRLIRAGGALPAELSAVAARLGVSQHIVELPSLSSRALAAVYRRASVLLVPSDREGFSLPIAEALASGTPVIANDLAALRETGGGLARYRRNDDLEGWCEDVLDLVRRPREEVLSWQASARAGAARFSWHAAAERLLPIYQELHRR